MGTLGDSEDVKNGVLRLGAGTGYLWTHINLCVAGCTRYLSEDLGDGSVNSFRLRWLAGVTWET
jgi:hypothetical protein